MSVYKLATAGSVDDGKSTLIGRILYDTGSLTEDKIQAIEQKSRVNGFDYVDFSLATDGLVAEREQGITIDVAHIYFAYKGTSFIIADTPGHAEYTRNMITGASTSQASLILVDARNGVSEQTYRHFFINQLLQKRRVIVCINKMDLVDYDQDKYEDIVKYVRYLSEKFGFENQKLDFVPVSALKGENLISSSQSMHWYKGKPLMDLILEDSKSVSREREAMRFPIQHVLRPKQGEFHDYRAYAGKVYGDTIRKGDSVVVYPSLQKAKVSSIHVFEGEIEHAQPNTSVSIQLDREVNLSRGDLLVKEGENTMVSKNIQSKLCWMDAQPLEEGKIYLFRHGPKEIKSKVISIDGIYDITDGSIRKADNRVAALNEIALVSLKLSAEIYFDSFCENSANGHFVLIDPKTNNTSGLGFYQ